VVFIPVTDNNRRSWIRYHYVTVVLIALCVLVFVLQIAGDENRFVGMVYAFGAIPSGLFGLRELPEALAVIPTWMTLITSMFLHGGAAHLAGNMIFLWVFGDNVEDAMGHLRFVAFYLLCGVIAALAHATVDFQSTTPMIGASGAISGVLGAYFILHPRVQVWIVVFAFIPVRLPTYVVLGGWILMQIVFSFMAQQGTEQVAWWAHIAGFAAGAFLIRYFRYPHVALWDTSETGTIDVSGVRFRHRVGNRNEGDNT